MEMAREYIELSEKIDRCYSLSENEVAGMEDRLNYLYQHMSDRELQLVKSWASYRDNDE